MHNLEGGNQSEAPTIGPTDTMDKGKRPENVVLHIEETSGSSPDKDPSPLHNVQAVPSRDGVLEKIQDKHVQLLHAVLKGDWNAAKTIIDKQKDILYEPITRDSEIALHIAVAAKHKRFVRNLLVEMDTADLTQRNKNQNTALYFAAATGDVEIAKMLIERNEHLPDIPGGGDMTPIHMAALFGHREMVIYLYKKTHLELLSDINLLNLFTAIISMDIYDVALKMLQKMAHRNLASSQNSDGETALHLMARKHSTISRKSQLNLFQKLANSVFKDSFHEAKMQTSAHQLVEELWKSVLQLTVEKISNLLKSPTRLLFDAAKCGNVEFLVILIRHYPNLIWKVDEMGRSLFHIAAINRHQKIFKIIYELRGIKDLIASYEEVPLQMQNEPKNNLLHLVAHLPPLNRLRIVSGAALQMQRELLWFKAVEEIVPRSYIKAKNKDGKVAHDIFTNEHEDLRKEGEKWMKETATACMLVATLIATVVFAAALAVPGGYDETPDEPDISKIPGLPRFRKKFLFDMFILSDSVSFLSSVTAIVLFLSILTSRYAEDDFRKALPTKLMLGILALFVSIISMVLAFTLAMILIRHQEPTWSLVLIIFLASLTATSFTVLHFQLWSDTLRSAYLSGFLFYGRKSGIFL